MPRPRRYGEGTIRERVRADGSTVFQARWYVLDPVKGERTEAKSFATLEAAEDYLRGVERKKRDGEYASPSTMTVTQLVDEYLDRAASRVSGRTLLTHRRRAELMIAPTIGRKLLRTITPLDVQRWIDGLIKSDFKPSTIHAAVAVLNGALREAAMLGVTDRHLGQGVRRPTIGRPIANVWTIDEARRVIEATKDDPIFGALYHVALVTGMRPGELRALMWRDVNFETGTLTVCRTITKGERGGELIAERTKSKQPRAIALADATLDVLRRHRARQREREIACLEWQPLGLVFDRGDGHWIFPMHWQRIHQRLCERIGVPAIRAHDLRHTVATLMMETNVHPKVVADVLGHSEIQMTLDRYSHVSSAMQRTATDALSERLSNSVSKLVGADEGEPERAGTGG